MMSLEMPVIGLTASRMDIHSQHSRVNLSEKYQRMLLKAGALPLVLPGALHVYPAEAWANTFDGLLLTGGGDIHQDVAGGSPSPTLMDVDVLRDELEFFLVRLAVNAGLPFLGICRGIQVINAALGGSLHSDLRESGFSQIEHDYNLGEPPGELAHAVNIPTETRLFGIAGRETVMVNSHHHQGVARVADDLVVSAYSVDGVVEGLELRNPQFFGMGVQWHPECLPDSPLTISLMSEFISAATSYAKCKREKGGLE